MKQKVKSIRPFIGAKAFNRSREFYRDLGFHESVISEDMSLFVKDQLGFYLQNAYIADWIDNTMVFMEVEDVDLFWEELQSLKLPEKYPGARLTGIKQYDWGKECFVHDPSGVLWHFGQFTRNQAPI